MEDISDCELSDCCRKIMQQDGSIILDYPKKFQVIMYLIDYSTYAPKLTLALSHRLVLA